MSVRTTTKMVTFVRPFNLAGLADQLPAGGYLVETDETFVDGGASPAQHVATFFRLPQAHGPSSRRHSLRIDPRDLDAALSRDRTRARALMSGATPIAKRGRIDENA